jgi:hypothetical protein
VKLRLSAAFLVLLLAIAAAGCGGSSDSSTSSAASSTSSAAAPRAGSDAYILGTWHGELHQKGMPPFVVSAEVRSLTNPKRNTVAYTQIRCGGNWTYRGFAQGAYRFLEVIDRGVGGSCKGAGQVTLVPQGRDAARYEFRGGGVISRGTLHRSR